MSKTEPATGHAAISHARRAAKRAGKQEQWEVAPLREGDAADGLIDQHLGAQKRHWTHLAASDTYVYGWREESQYDFLMVGRIRARFAEQGMSGLTIEPRTEDGYAIRITVPGDQFRQHQAVDPAGQPGVHAVQPTRHQRKEAQQQEVTATRIGKWNMRMASLRNTVGDEAVAEAIRPAGFAAAQEARGDAPRVKADNDAQPAPMLDEAVRRMLMGANQWRGVGGASKDKARLVNLDTMGASIESLRASTKRAAVEMGIKPRAVEVQPARDGARILVKAYAVEALSKAEKASEVRIGRT